jgi:4-amino-4-deoxy-L-arabinose transferase-like glycosyltransferase
MSRGSMKHGRRSGKAVTPVSRVRLPAAAAPEDASAGPGRNRLIVMVLAVFLCALSLRLAFVREVVVQNSLFYGDLNSAPKAGFLIPPDSDAYVHLAKTFFSSYFGDQAGEEALWRTPGYPAFLIPFYRFGLAPTGILVAQAFLGALIPVLTLLLARLLTGSILLAGLAGLLSAVSPTGVGLSGLIMNDMLMAFLVGAGVYVFYLGTVRNRASWLIVAGALFGIGFTVKPILMLWPVVMIIAYYLFCLGEEKPRNWKALCVAIAIQVLILGLWCTRNFVYAKVFSPSSNINFAMHDYLRPRVEEWLKAGGLPDNLSVRRNRDEARRMVDKQSADHSAREKLDLMKSRSMEVFRAHPLVTLQVLLQDIEEHALAGWDYFRRQLPLGNAQLQRLNEAARLESSFREKALITVALFFSLLPISLCVRPSAARRRMLALSLVLVIIYGYFAVFSGTAFWGGSRIMYPVEFILLLLLVLALQAAGALSRKALAWARFLPGDALPFTGLLSRYGPWVMVLLTLGVGVYGTYMIMA